MLVITGIEIVVTQRRGNLRAVDSLFSFTLEIPLLSLALSLPVPLTIPVDKVIYNVHESSSVLTCAVLIGLQS